MYLAAASALCDEAAALTIMTTPPDPDDDSLERALRDSRRMEDAPEHAIQRALAQWKPRAAPAPARGLLQQVLAALTFDSGAAAPLAFGVRAVGGGTRQLLFSAPGCEVDLRIAPAAPGTTTDAARWQLSGQVLGADGACSVVLAEAAGRVLGEVTTSELGEFSLPDVSAGAYVLTLRLAEIELRLPPVQVPMPA